MRFTRPWASTAAPGSCVPGVSKTGAGPRWGAAAEPRAPCAGGPGFKVTTLSYVMSLMPDTIQRDLRLADHGYKATPVGPYLLPFPDGRAIVQYDDDARANYDSFAQFFRKDADAIVRWDAWIGGLADVLGPLLMSIPPTVGSKRPGDLAEQPRPARRFRRLDLRTPADVTRLIAMHVRHILDKLDAPDRTRAAIVAMERGLLRD